MIDYSSQNEVPVKLFIPSQGPSQPISNTIPTEEHSIFQIVLDEINTMPTVNTIDDVLRLRGDSRIKDFREAVHHWQKMILAGDGQGAANVRRDIQKSNREFENFKDFQQIGGWLTMASVPLAVLAVIFPFLTAAGVVTTIYSGGYNLLAYQKKKANRWLMFGQNMR